ncbi:LysR family transcriptional regulator [Streptomyces sp. NPDC014894]|uniref:helix-turn-helix domain-containing protein n=1 Tax=Streptomyces sp. NPDC014894 TaxID=3364931 RepID=UPI0036FDD343
MKVHGRDLRCFASVAEELDVTRAAGRSFVSRPSVSGHVCRWSGARRFHRDRGTVRPTATGEAPPQCVGCRRRGPPGETASRSHRMTRTGQRCHGYRVARSLRQSELDAPARAREGGQPERARPVRRVTVSPAHAGQEGRTRPCPRRFPLRPRPRRCPRFSTPPVISPHRTVSATGASC